MADGATCSVCAAAPQAAADDPAAARPAGPKKKIGPYYVVRDFCDACKDATTEEGAWSPGWKLMLTVSSTMLKGFRECNRCKSVPMTQWATILFLIPVYPVARFRAKEMDMSDRATTYKLRRVRR